MRHDENIWDSLQNLDENSEVLEWWLVTPYMAELLKENGEVMLAAYDCCWWGRQTGPLYGLGDSEDSRADAVRRTYRYMNSEGLAT